MFEKGSKLLVLAPHTDDGELGCGGTIAQFAKKGLEVHYVAFCTCDESLPDGYPNGTLAKELSNATAHLAIPEENLHILDYEVRRLSYHRQEVLEDLVKFNKSIRPDVVFCPTLEDVHQDHSTVANEALRAFKTRTILAYEMPWNNIHFHANFMIELAEEDVAQKAKALTFYESQRGRPYTKEEFVRSLARVRGTSIGCEYAEAFTLVRGVSRI